MRYRFRLETVLRVRRSEESAARDALHHSNAALVRAIEARDRALTRYREAESAVASDLEALLCERVSAELAARAVALAQRTVSRVASEAALAHVDWQRAARRVAALERLDERRRHEHVAQEGRREIARIDDIVAARYVSAHSAPATEQVPAR